MKPSYTYLANDPYLQLAPQRKQVCKPAKSNYLRSTNLATYQLVLCVWLFVTYGPYFVLFPQTLILADWEQ